MRTTTTSSSHANNLAEATNQRSPTRRLVALAVCQAASDSTSQPAYPRGREPKETTLLAQILPGIREVRGPLASGFLWLLLGWLIFHDRVASSEGAIGDLVDLGGVVSDAALAVAASFVAYLIGSLSEDAFGRVLNNAVRSLVEDPYKPHQLATESPSEFRQWKYQMQSWEEMSERFRESEIARLENQSDRMRAERDLRIAILPPMTAIIIYLSATDSWWWALALLLVPALAVQAWLRTREYLLATMALRELRRRAGVPPASVAEVEAEGPEPEPEPF